MKPIRYPYLLLLLCLLAGTRTAQAQCSASAVAIPVTCFGQSNGLVDLTANNGAAPYTYAWSNFATTEDLSALPAGTYTCTVTDNLGCTATAETTVTQPQALTVEIPGITLNCVVLSASLNPLVSGGNPTYNYQWGNGATTNTIQVQQPGAYFLTVTDVNGCTTIKTALVQEDIIPPVACAGQDFILNCNVLQLMLDGSCSSIGTNFVYAWATTNGHLISGLNTPTPNVDAPGSYMVTVTNTANGCTSTDVVFVLQDANTPTVSVTPELELPCGGTLTLPAVGVSGPNFTFSWTTLDGNILSGGFTLNPIINEPGTYTVLVVNIVNGCTATASVVVTGGGTLCSKIEGRVLQDTMANCQTDAGEPPISGWIVKAQGAMGNYYALTDSNGNYQISVATGGTYAVSAVASSGLWLPCPVIPTVAAPNPDETYFAADLLFQKLAGCPLLTVDLSSGNLRRCFANNHFSVSYCNNGTAPAEDTYVEVTLDPLFTPEGSSIPFTDLGGGVLRFAVGDIAVGECGFFDFTALLSCNAVLGQTHCTEAHIYPDSSCIPINPLWSGASLQISSACLPDSVRFTIKNIGTGNMPNALDYIVVEDQVMLMSAPVQLDAGESVTVSVPANGSTWHLEVAQEPYHPGQSAPAVSVEGCTTGASFSTGFVNIFPADDEDEFIDIDCKANTASSDPNDKQGYPIGYGAQHYIRPGTQLEYLIQFQNTGNDTAFTVRVVDTLSAGLDPATFRPGASSHPYTWDLSGAGTLTFLYKNILLPDSNVNEPASHGFFKFTIHPRADAPLETVIHNTAEIYFDFNEAIITNTTFHRLGENFVTVGSWQPLQPEYAVLVSPNPFSDAATLEIKGLRENGPLHLQVFDLQGKMQLKMESEHSVFQLNKGVLPSGVYLFNIGQAGKIVGSGKLVVQN